MQIGLGNSVEKAGRAFLPAQPSMQMGALLWSLGIALLSGCSSSGSQDDVTKGANVLNNQPPVVRKVTLVPTPLTLAGPLAVQIDVHDPDGQQLTTRVQWIVNGAPVTGVNGPELRPDLVKRGDMVAVEVVASDGEAESVPFRTEPVQVVNTPPILTRVMIEADGPQGSNRVQAKVDAADPDRDEIQYTYQWWHNDKQVTEGTENALDTTGYGRKDIVGVEVIARDQESASLAMRATPIVLGNSPPEITSNPAVLNNREQYDYAVQVKDIDGDPITFALETAPPGMSIDKTSGQVTWKVTPGLTGTHRVKIVAEDGQGGSTWQEFEVTIPSTAQTATQSSPQG